MFQAIWNRSAQMDPVHDCSREARSCAQDQRVLERELSKPLRKHRRRVPGHTPSSPAVLHVEFAPKASEAWFLNSWEVGELLSATPLEGVTRVR